jgi:hypothetical protein
MKFVVEDFKAEKSRHKKASSSVRTKRMRTADGRIVPILSLDANSATFIDDLAIVFKKNVAKARRENRRLFGSPDGLRAKHR